MRLVVGVTRSSERASVKSTRRKVRAGGATLRGEGKRHSPSIAIDIDIVEVKRDIKYIRTRVRQYTDRIRISIGSRQSYCTNKQTRDHIAKAARPACLRLHLGKGPTLIAILIKDRDAFMSIYFFGFVCNSRTAALSGLKPCPCPAGRFPCRWRRPS